MNNYTQASEAYLGKDSILSLTPIITRAQGYYAAGDIDASFKALKELCKEIKVIFNFKEVTINFNETITGFRLQDLFDINGGSGTKSITSCYLIDGNKKSGDNFVIKNGTYKCKTPTVHCDLSIYAPIMLNSKEVSPEEFLAALIREIGYKFYIWTKGDDIYSTISYILKFIMIYIDKLKSFRTLKVGWSHPAIAVLQTFRYFVAPRFIQTKSTKGTKSGFLKLIFDKVANIAKNTATIALAPVFGIIAILFLPVQTLLGFIFSKILGMKFNDCDNFADEFCASYGLGPELVAMGHKDQYGKGMDKLASVVSDFTGLSILMYTASSLNIGGCTHKTAVLPRIDNLIRYYTEELNRVSNKSYKDELVEKIKALKATRKEILGLPETKWSIGQVFVRWYSSNFGASGEAMKRLDTQAESLDKAIKS